MRITVKTVFGLKTSKTAIKSEKGNITLQHFDT